MSYLIKVTTKEGGQKIPKNLTTWFMNDPKGSLKNLEVYFPVFLLINKIQIQ